MFELNSDQTAIKNFTRDLADTKLKPIALEVDKKGEYAQRSFEILRDAGLFTVPFSTQLGGTGSLLSACIVMEELCKVCYNSGNLLSTQWMAFRAILAAGNEAQKTRLLNGLSSGEIRASFASTESQSGSDVAGIKTRAQKVDGGYRLNGAKAWCTGARISDFIVVAAKTANAEGRDGISLFIVPKNSPGMTVGADENKMGARGLPTSEVFFDDVFVPAEDRLGPEGEGFKSVMEAFSPARLIVAARGTGLAIGAMELAVEYTSTRIAFGQKVADFQGIRWMLADMDIQVSAARALLYQCAQAFDRNLRGKEMSKMASIAKCHATDTAMRVAQDATQLFGAAGISMDCPINRYYRDAKILQIVEGTNQIQRNVIGKNVIESARRSAR